MKTDGAEAAQVCDVCGCADYAVFMTKGRGGSDLTTVICDRCGLVYSNPRPSDDDTAAFYKSDYWGAYKGATDPGEAFFQRRLPKNVSMIEQLEPILRPGLRVLEIGTGVGAMLWMIKRACGDEGEFVGVEPHEGHARFARQKKGLDVRAGLLEERAGELPREHFDLVLMNHVLEHTISPTATLRTVRELLRPGGHFVIEVPNVEQPGSRLSHYFHVAHNYAFSPQTLRRLALATGYDVERLASLDGDLPGTRLFADIVATDTPASTEDVGDDAALRAEALRRYERWYWMTGASLRKKVTHWQRQRRSNLRAVEMA